MIHCYTFAAAPYARDGTLERLGLVAGGAAAAAADAGAPEGEANGVLESNRGTPPSSGTGSSAEAGALHSREVEDSEQSTPSRSGEEGAESSDAGDATAPSGHHSAAEREAIAIEDATQRVLHALGVVSLKAQRERVRKVQTIQQVVRASTKASGPSHGSSSEALEVIPVCGRVIRDVSPNKFMVCISVRVPADCGCATPSDDDDDRPRVVGESGGAAAKRPRVD